MLIAQQALAAMGAFSAPSDTVTRANVTFLGGEQPTQGTVTLKTRGLGQVRAEFATVEGSSVAVWNAGRGSRRDPDGSAHHYTRAETLNKRADHLPLFSMLAESADPAVAVRLLATESVNGAPAWRIELQRPLSPDEDPNGLYEPFSGCEVYVDQATGLVARIRYRVPSVNNLRDHYPVEFDYGDYRAVSGLAVPHRIVQSIAGHQVAIFQITGFTVNNGLSDSDFSVPR